MNHLKNFQLLNIKIKPKSLSFWLTLFIWSYFIKMSHFLIFPIYINFIFNSDIFICLLIPLHIIRSEPYFNLLSDWSSELDYSHVSRISYTVLSLFVKILTSTCLWSIYHQDFITYVLFSSTFEYFHSWGSIFTHSSTEYSFFKDRRYVQNIIIYLLEWSKIMRCLCPTLSINYLQCFQFSKITLWRHLCPFSNP